MVKNLPFTVVRVESRCCEAFTPSADPFNKPFTEIVLRPHTPSLTAQAIWDDFGDDLLHLPEIKAVLNPSHSLFECIGASEAFNKSNIRYLRLQFSGYE